MSSKSATKLSTKKYFDKIIAEARAKRGKSGFAMDSPEKARCRQIVADGIAARFAEPSIGFTMSGWAKDIELIRMTHPTSRIVSIDRDKNILKYAPSRELIYELYAINFDAYVKHNTPYKLASNKPNGRLIDNNKRVPVNDFDWPTFQWAFLDFTGLPKPELLTDCAKFIDREMSSDFLVAMTFSLSRSKKLKGSVFIKEKIAEIMTFLDQNVGKAYTVLHCFEYETNSTMLFVMLSSWPCGYDKLSDNLRTLTIACGDDND